MRKDPAWTVGKLALFSVVGGAATGYLICPLLNYFMGVLPVPYSWISAFPEHWRSPIFLAGAYLLFLPACILTSGLLAGLIGFSSPSGRGFPVTFVFCSAAFTYSCFIFDASLLADPLSWLGRTTSWLYLAELASMYGLMILSAHVGARLRVYAG